MFIFSFVSGAIQIVIVGVLGLALYRDYKKGFPFCKSILEKIQGKFSSGSETDKGRRILEGFAQGIGKLRDATATIKANHQLAVRQAEEQHRLVLDAQEIEEMAIRQGDESAAGAAAVAKIQAEKRAELFSTHAEVQEKAAVIMLDELDSAEMQFEVMKTEVETLRVNEAIIEAETQLYELVSEVNAKAGFTIKGDFEQLKLDSERRRLKAGALLEIVGRNGVSKVRRFMERLEVQRELEETRRRISLPAHSSGNAGFLESAETIGDQEVKQ